MKSAKPLKRRGRPTGTTKLKARAALDQLASTRGFDHLLINAGSPGEPGSKGKPSGGAQLMAMFVEGEFLKTGQVVSQREIKKAIRSRRRRPPKAKD